MARPERTDVRARHYLLSGDHSPLWGRGHYKLESFGFWGRKFCIKNVELFAVGKIAEFARFAGGERRKSPDRFSLIRAAASYRKLPSMAFVERLRGQVPLNFDNGEFNKIRFATRAGALWGESQVSNYFVKNR